MRVRMRGGGAFSQPKTLYRSKRIRIVSSEVFVLVVKSKTDCILRIWI